MRSSYPLGVIEESLEPWKSLRPGEELLVPKYEKKTENTNLVECLKFIGQNLESDFINGYI